MARKIHINIKVEKEIVVYVDDDANLTEILEEYVCAPVMMDDQGKADIEEGSVIEWSHEITDSK
jgi:hypothetical protein|tara:strand:+ start:793 stop:984 length:192 start_codon:yes stop_codon:yes gene_type:complete